MKKWMAAVCMAALMLGGCGAEETMETVADEWDVPAMAVPREILLGLPEEAAVSTMESDSGKFYQGDGYEIAVQRLDAGDLDGTLRSLTGFGRDNLTVIQTQSQDLRRYEFVWTSAGESGSRLGQGMILDDGTYHYCLSVLRDDPMPEDSQIVWNDLFRSFALE